MIEWVQESSALGAPSYYWTFRVYSSPTEILQESKNHYGTEAQTAVAAQAYADWFKSHGHFVYKVCYFTIDHAHQGCLQVAPLAPPSPSPQPSPTFPRRHVQQLLPSFPQKGRRHGPFVPPMVFGVGQLDACSQACENQYGVTGGKPDALALLTCFAQCNTKVAPPGGLTLPGGTTLPSGWTLPGGLSLPAGWAIPSSWLPPGWMPPAAPPPNANGDIPLPLGWILPGNWTLPGAWTLPGPLTLPAGAPLPAPPLPAPSPAPSPSPTPSPSPQTPSAPEEKKDNTIWWALGGVALLGVAIALVATSKMPMAGVSELEENPLVTSQNTRAAEKKVKSAAAAKFGRGRANVFFEHGQWWADVDGRFWSAVDVRPGIAHGIDFEPIG